MSKKLPTEKIHKLPELSFFMPAYNEAANIRESMRQALVVLPKVAEKFELIVINDGSVDNTLHIAKAFKAENPDVVRVINQKNTGYGGALKKGFEKAKYEWVFFTDSDLQFNVEELINFLPYTHSADLVIGHRLQRAEGWTRHMLARSLKVWNFMWLDFPVSIKDIDCAFKLIKKEVINDISPLVSDGAMISTEILLKSYLASYKIDQVGVHHYQRHAGMPTGNDVRVIFKAVYDTFVLRKVMKKFAKKHAA
jgi:glycosyltransferase involved in cell wall biosynthesis